MARVLVVEDEEAVAQFIARALDMQGHDLEVAEDGAAGWKLATGQVFDLVITDIRLPMLDGIALAMALGEERPDLPILLMTGFSDKFHGTSDLHDLCVGLLVKPFTLAELQDAVEAALAAST